MFDLGLKTIKKEVMCCHQNLELFVHSFWGLTYCPFKRLSQ